ncbi:hypothetical protein [Komagataeibacter diospyri]|uniref:Uncharacterized protein n=1 Tax=Komagataeibacter diospyri TaxID=1932662 RepID=A0A4P5NSV9_9PROT|nr:hypothetical protein [Komagataeibacter diospyri]GCE82921.1 hypothetical protein MSKU9_1062 [Komagataeibacter diospyri]
MRYSDLRFATMLLLGAGLVGSIVTPAHARTHAVTDMEADRLTLGALTAPPPPVRHVTYVRRAGGHRVPVVMAANHSTAAHTRRTMVHTIAYHPHGAVVHHIHPIAVRHRT